MKIKNKRAVERLTAQGLSLETAVRTVRDISYLGYSPETITKQMSAKEIIEIIESVDRALARAFPNGLKGA